MLIYGGKRIITKVMQTQESELGIDAFRNGVCNSMTNRVRRYISRNLKGMSADQMWNTEDEVRNYFEIYTGKCVDGGWHNPRCTLILIEEKSDSDINGAIMKFESIKEVLHARGYRIDEFVLIYNSLRLFKNYYSKRGEWLFDDTRNARVQINNIPVRAVQIRRS